MRTRTRVVLVLVAGLLWSTTVSAQTLVIFVRHAERADAGAPQPSMTGTPADPRLSPAGEARAARLASILAEAGIKAIFTTEFKRTQDTGRPLASKLGLTSTTIPSGDTAALVARLKSEHKTDVVLVVGHSNTIPAIIKALGGPEVAIADTEYDNLFIFIPATGTLTRIRY